VTDAHLLVQFLLHFLVYWEENSFTAYAACR
jgi:hypothetical protein